MLGGNAEFMAKAQMRKEQFCEKLLNPEAPQDALPEQVEALLIEADGHGDTTDANILAARARFDELYRQYKDEIAEEAEEVRAAGGLFIIGHRAPREPPHRQPAARPRRPSGRPPAPPGST